MAPLQQFPVRMHRIGEGSLTLLPLELCATQLNAGWLSMFSTNPSFGTVLCPHYIRVSTCTQKYSPQTASPQLLDTDYHSPQSRLDWTNQLVFEDGARPSRGQDAVLVA